MSPSFALVQLPKPVLLHTLLSLLLHLAMLSSVISIMVTVSLLPFHLSPFPWSFSVV
jgi:hypothetical protein